MRCVRNNKRKKEIEKVVFRIDYTPKNGPHLPLEKFRAMEKLFY